MKGFILAIIALAAVTSTAYGESIIYSNCTETSTFAQVKAVNVLKCSENHCTGLTSGPLPVAVKVKSPNAFNGPINIKFDVSLGLILKDSQNLVVNAIIPAGEDTIVNFSPQLYLIPPSGQTISWKATARTSADTNNPFACAKGTLTMS